MYLKFTRILSFILLFSTLSIHAQKVSIYLVAHPDDWQLFMGKDAYDDILYCGDTNKVVFVYLTSGDGGNGLNTESGKGFTEPLYTAREHASRQSTEMAADDHHKRSVWKFDTAEINSHKILRSFYRNISSYYLRLPDGQVDGSSSLSLNKFRGGYFTDHYSIDSVNCYKGWQDLLATLHLLLVNESEGYAEKRLGIPDTAISDVYDHMDHLAAGFAGVAAADGLNFKKRFYTGYASGTSATPNLSLYDAQKEAGLFAVYVRTLMDAGYDSEWNKDYLEYCNKNIYREDGEVIAHSGDSKMKILFFVLWGLFFASVIGGSIYTFRK